MYVMLYVLMVADFPCIVELVVMTRCICCQISLAEDRFVLSVGLCEYSAFAEWRKLTDCHVSSKSH